MVCDSCKQSFKRERHFKSHKCKVSDDLYLKPEDIPELEEGFDSRKKFPVAGSVISEINVPEVDADETEVCSKVICETHTAAQYKMCWAVLIII